MAEHIFFSTATLPTTDRDTQGRIIVANALNGGVFNGRKISTDNARSASLDLLERVNNGGVTGEGRHTPLADRVIGNEAILWESGSWDDVGGLTLEGRWLETDNGRNARVVAESGAPFGVSILATAETSRDGETTLIEILHVDAVHRPAVPNRVIAYAAEVAEGITKMEETEILGGSADVVEVEQPTVEEIVSDDQPVQFSQETISEMIAKAVAAELARPAQRTSRPVIASALPAAQKRGDGDVVTMSALVAQKAEKEGVKVGKLPDRLRPIADRYRQVNAARLAMEEVGLRSLVQFGQDWSTLAAPCSVVGAIYERVCARSYGLSVFPSSPMQSYCVIVEDFEVVDDAEFPAQVPVTASPISIATAGVWFALSGTAASPSSVVLTHVANPALVWVLGQDFIVGDDGILILASSPKLVANGGVVDLAVSPAFTVSYSASLLQNGACQPAGRKVIKAAIRQVEAKIWKIALRYCDAEMFQIQSRYGSDFARRVLSRVVSELSVGMDISMFTAVWNSVYTTSGSSAGVWSQSLNTIENLIGFISSAAASLIDGECASQDEIVVLTTIANADILGRANECCRIDATNNGDSMGMVGTVTHHKYPLYAIPATNFVYNGILVIPRSYLRYFVFQPLSIKETAGIERDFVAPNGVTYSGTADVTTWTATMQTAQLIMRPTQGRYITVTA